jgi:hypothetical protein
VEEILSVNATNTGAQSPNTLSNGQWILPLKKNVNWASPSVKLAELVSTNTSPLHPHPSPLPMTNNPLINNLHHQQQQ